MISGAHIIIYTQNADADRAFFRDVLGFQSVDAGHGWLIFALPPSEAAFHPSEKNGPARTLFHVRRFEGRNVFIGKKECKVLKGQGRTMGFDHRITASRRRQDRLYQPKHHTAIS